jgi:hypothetical protein
MKTITSVVNDILPKRPFLEESLLLGLINYSALAGYLQREVSEILGKEVKTGAILMAIRRYSQAPALDNTNHNVKEALGGLGDITVKSNLTDFTFENSATLLSSQTKLLQKIGDDKKVFYAYTRGINESNLVINTSFKATINDCFIDEKCLSEEKDLNAISIQLPKNNPKISGLYYQIFKQIAWEGISIYEVISTTNEFTLIVEDKVTDKAFSIVKKLNLTAN